MRTSSVLLICLHCIYGLVSPEEHDRERRDLSMLRMGKRGMEDLPPLVPPNYEVGDEYEERALGLPESSDFQWWKNPRTGKDLDEQEWIPRPGRGMEEQEWIPRVGKEIGGDDARYERHPPFPRIGKTFRDYLNTIRREINDDDLRNLLMKYSEHAAARSRSRRSVGDESHMNLETDSHKDKRFPRIGLENRAMPFPRLGLRETEGEENKRHSLDFPRGGYSTEEFERAMPFPRIGLVERAFPRMGLQERALPMPRMGYKRAMGMLRMGRSSDDALEEEEEKRGMSMLRMGKRAMSMLRMGKRPVSMLRMGRSQEMDAEEEKRAMGMLRMGKRAMGMLRMGRSSDADITDEEKRAMGMLRMGKRGMGMLRMGRSDNSEYDEKRAMGMLRMGRSEPQEEEKRAMSMLRMGKRPVSMLRMGKRDTEIAESASADADADTESS